MLKIKSLCVFKLALTFLVIFNAAGQTVVEIKGNQFYINGSPTYPNRSWNNLKIEGLVINSRMVQGIFDDLNPETAQTFAYPDTKKWDAKRNNQEFVSNMSLWHSYGLNCFTINMQGGSPTGYGTSKCINSGFNQDGSLNADYLDRLDKVLKEADRLKMVVILGLFYFGQDQYLHDEKAVRNATNQMVDWLFKKKYRNVLLEIANETSENGSYNHPILYPNRIHELINLVKEKKKNGYRYLVGTSFRGLIVPTSNVIKTSDFVLIHGNGGSKTEQIQDLINKTMEVDGFRIMPMINNEDDHFDFEKETNNLTTSLKNYVSWGYFDYRLRGETNIIEGYQTVPVDWGINSQRKKAFFEKIKEITGGFQK